MQKKRMRASRSLVEDILTSLHRTHKQVMEDITQGDVHNWLRYPMAVMMNDKICSAIEQLEGALRVFESLENDQSS